MTIASDARQPATGRPANRVHRQPLSHEEHRRLRRKVRLRRELTAWAFLLPQFTFFVLFLVVPVIGVVWWSLLKGDWLGGTKFVGLDNFARLPRQQDAMAAISNTFVFALLSIPLTLVFALLIALVLSRVRRGASTYRFLVYFPVLVPGVVAGLIWFFLTNVDFGLFDALLRSFGAPPVTWLGGGTALPVLAAVDIWRSVGYWSIFFLAALIGLPQELYQAAELDGASSWQRFRRLTIPLLRRIILFAVVVSTIFGLQVFDTVVILTQGGPATSTVTIVYRIWTYVFGESGKVGYGAAISLALLAAILLLTLIQLRVLRGRRGEVA